MWRIVVRKVGVLWSKNLAYEIYKHTYLDLAHLGGHARHIVPPLSSSRSVIADEKISYWGKEPSRSSLLSLLFVTFLFRFFVTSDEEREKSLSGSSPEPNGNFW